MLKNRVLILFSLIVFIPQALLAARIVSLVPSITQAIILLDANDQLVGITSFCPKVGNKNVEIVASAIDANVEKIVSLKPDVVFTSSLTKIQTIESFKKLGIRVVNLDYPTSYDDICNQFAEIAKVVGKEPFAAKILEEQKERLNMLKSKITGNDQPTVFLEIGAKPLFTVVPNTFMHDLIVYSGGKNIAGNLTKGSVTRELVLVRDPDYLFIVTMGLVSQEELKIWNQYKNLKAVRNKHVFLLDPEKACTPTPVNFVDTVEEMIRLMWR